jgi:hypothetical protein
MEEIPITQQALELDWINEQYKQYRAEVDPVLKQYDAEITRREALLLASLPDGVDSMSTINAAGDKITFGRKHATQFRINNGMADEYYNWVYSNQRFDLMPRSMLQTGLEAEVKRTNQLPPGLYVHTESKFSFTKKRAAPTT